MVLLRLVHPVYIFTLLALPAAPAQAAATSGGGIKCDCAGGKPHCQMDGQDLPADMGANTPTKKGTIPKMEPCVGSSFACMAGKDCITIEGAFKFHKTKCGSGDEPPTGAMGTAGCVHVTTETMEKLKTMEGQPFEVMGCGGGSQDGPGGR